MSKNKKVTEVMERAEEEDGTVVTTEEQEAILSEEQAEQLDSEMEMDFNEVLVNGEYLGLLQAVLQQHTKIDNLASFTGALSGRLDSMAEAIAGMDMFLQQQFPGSKTNPPHIREVVADPKPPKPDFLKK